MAFLETLIRLFTEHGYIAVFVVLLMSGFGIPLPEDISLVAGGVIAGLGYADVHVMAVVGLAGVLIGDVVMFLTGRYFGNRVLRWRWVSYVLTPRRYAKVQHKYARYGSRLMFVARFLPGLRTAIYITAGMSRRVSFAQFLFFDGLAAAISVPFWVYLGYFGAENHQWLVAWVKRGESVVLVGALLLIGLVAWFWWRRKGRAHARLRALRAHRAKRQAQPHDPTH
ncbi:DedA family protein [Dokdonella sp.]|uniref:DedA family protein n=1 Tax=Dokdonella sp. TaxID=2291710 RepID=UPI001B05A7E6|nr:DedA family protein [Dokdonella sp.]MBO9661448.1 DedA family protein [Dokdonella sp.]